jgi:DNA-binding transcriptional ArsR family regulator
MMAQMSNQSRTPTRARPGCPAVGRILDPRFFRALGDPNRIHLLARLARCRGPCTVSQLAACCPVDLSVVSRHLTILRDAGILEARKRGKEVFYTVRFDTLAGALHRMADAIEACCPQTVANPTRKSP